MACKIKKDRAFDIASNQVGKIKASRLALRNQTKGYENKIPTVSSIMGTKVEEGTLMGAKPFLAGLKSLEAFNRENATSIAVEFSRRNGRVTVKSLSHNYASTNSVGVRNARLAETTDENIYAINDAMFNEPIENLELPSLENPNALILSDNYESEQYFSSDMTVSEMDARNRDRNEAGLESLPHYQKYTPSEDKLSDKDLSERVAHAERTFGVKIVMSDEISSYGNVIFDKDGKPTVQINKTRAQSDTVFHELVGHLFIESIGGMGNVRVKALADKLKNEPIWAEIAARYPELSGDALALEVVADAVGKSADQIFTDNAKKSSFNRFMDWLTSRVSKLLGMAKADAYTLAREGLEADISGYRSSGQRNQKFTLDEIGESLENSKTVGTKEFIEFDEEAHEYKFDNQVAATSASEIASEDSTFKKYENPINMEQMQNEIYPPAVHVALKNLGLVAGQVKSDDVLGLVNDEARAVTLRWTKTAEWGTKVHAIIEDVIEGGDTSKYGPEYAEVVREGTRLRSLRGNPDYSVISEARMFDKESGIAGSVDIIIINKKAGTIEVIDFKTKALNEDGTFSRIQDSVLNKYDMQTSVYAAMLEKKYGLPVSKTSIKVFGLQFNSDNTALLEPVKEGAAIQLNDRTDHQTIFNKAAVRTGLSMYNLNDTVTTVQEAVDTVLTNINALVRSTVKYNTKETRESNLEFERKLKSKFEADEAQGMLYYIEDLVVRTEEVRADLEIWGDITDHISIDAIGKVKFKAAGLQSLSAIEAYIDANEATLENLGIKAGMDNLLSELKREREFINKSIRTQAIKILAIELTNASNLQSVKRKDTYELEFQENNPQTGLRTFKLAGEKVNKKEWLAAREAYVMDKLLSTMDSQKRDALQMWSDYLTKGHFDISMFERLIMDASKSSSILLQTVNKMFSSAELATRKDTHDVRNEFDNTVKAYLKSANLSVDQLHEILSDKDSEGNKTGMLTGKYQSRVYTDLNELSSEIDEMFYSGDSNTDAYKELIAERKALRTKYLDKDGGIMDEFINPAYAEHAEIIDAYTDLMKRSDENLRGTAPLGSSVYGSKHKFYKLPAMRASTVEQALNNGVIAGLKEQFGSMTQHRVGDETPEGIAAAEEALHGDTTSIKVKTSLSGTAEQSVPIYFRGDIPIAEQSFDISTMLLENYNMSSDFKFKSDIQPKLEMIEELMRDTRPYDTLGVSDVFKINANSKLGRKLRIADQSNESQALTSLIEDRLYGDRETGAGKRVMRFVTSWSANTALVANFLAGGNNLIQGVIANFMDSAASEHMTAGDMKRGEKAYFGEMGAIMDDIGRTTPKARINVLLQLFDIQGMFETVGTEFFKDNKALKTLANGHGHALSSIGEHFIAGSLLNGVTRGIKLMNATGQYLDIDGNITEKENAASLNDAIVVEDGIMKYNIDFHTTSLNPTKPYSEVEISLYMKDIAADLHGQYDPKMQSHIQRFALGKAVFSLRKWTTRLYTTRFRGITQIGQDWSELDEFHKSYSEAQIKFNEGRYSSTARLSVGIAKDLYKLKQFTATKNWNKLNDAQKNNVLKTIYELGMATLALIASGLLYGLHEDDDDDVLYLYLAYQTRRTYSELSMFINPKEAFRIVQTPAVGLNQVNNTIDLVSRLLPFGSDLTEEYVKGDRKGQWKIQKETERLLPGIRQYRSIADLQAKYNFITTGGH